MTRQEYTDDVENIDQLLSIADDFDYEFDDVYSEDQYDDEINDQLRNDDGSWKDVKDWLNNLPDGYDFYVQDRWGDWEGRGYEEIDDLKEQFLNWADEDGEVFEEEDDEEYDEEEYDDSEPEAEDPEPESDLTLDDILSVLWDGAQETA